MAKYRKKPVEVDAFHWLGDNLNEVMEWARQFGGDPEMWMDDGDDRLRLAMVTVHGDTAYAYPQDWVIPEPTPDRFYPVQADVFADTYEPVEVSA